MKLLQIGQIFSWFTFGRILFENFLLKLPILLSTQHEMWENATKKTLASLYRTNTTLKKDNIMQLILEIETESYYSLQATNLNIGIRFTNGIRNTFEKSDSSQYMLCNSLNLKKSEWSRNLTLIYRIMQIHFQNLEQCNATTSFTYKTKIWHCTLEM